MNINPGELDSDNKSKSENTTDTSNNLDSVTEDNQITKFRFK